MQRNLLQKIDFSFSVTPAVALLGPRQCGKTTLAKMFTEEREGGNHWFDLENPVDLARLENPMLALQELSGLIVIDEIQRAPELFPFLRVLIDQKLPQQFLILGSASRDLISQSSESLAGRLSYLELTPFSLNEVGIDARSTHWLRGGFPLSFLAESNQKSFSWRESYIRTFLEQDIPALGITIPPLQLRRFWMMLAHYHGQICNFSELGRSLGVSDTTARNYLDILTSTFMIRELSPWFENIGKREIKRPKVYFRDSGIFHSLLGLDSSESLHSHPILGLSWEGYALEEITRVFEARPEECFFWGVHSQADLDLLVVKGNKRLAFEIKYQDAPKLSASIKAAIKYLKLDQLTVVYPGSKAYQLSPEVKVVPLAEITAGRPG